MTTEARAALVAANLDRLTSENDRTLALLGHCVALVEPVGYNAPPLHCPSRAFEDGLYCTDHTETDEDGM